MKVPAAGVGGRLVRLLTWVGVAALVLFALLVLEATGGHDGWLCEWGIDTGPTSSGCT